MKPTLLVVITLLFSSLQVFAQNTVNITGQVKDEQTKDNLPYCNVVALNGKDSIVRGGITDDNGFFALPLSPGQYKLVISFYGYESDTVVANVQAQEEFLGVFKLKARVLDVDEVKVESSSRLDILEKDVQIITDEQRVGSTAAKDVLDKITGISYDEYAGTLKVDSDANIMILVNGVEKSQEYVQNLDPDRLIRVETIRDPGGRYGLEGYSAVLNIILKRNYRGSELYLEQMQLVDIVSEHNKLDYMIGSLVATYNYTKNDLNIYGSAFLGRKNFKISSDTKTTYADGVVVDESSQWRIPNTNILEYDADYTLGMDYRINPKHLISFESTVQALPLGLSEETINYETSVFDNGVLIEEYSFDSKNRSRKFNNYNTVFYIADFNERTKLNVNFTYSNYKDSYSRVSSQENYYDRDENGENRKQYTRAYAELDYLISDKFSVQVGYGNTWRKLNNDFEVVSVDPNTNVSTAFSSDFQLTDMRHKLYSNLSWRMGAKWSTRVGLAGETSSPRTLGQNPNYVIFQPMYDLRFVPNKKINFNLKYRTSSAYPSIAETNPFTSLENPRVTSTGNPFLKPSTTHRFSLRINVLQGLLALEPYVEYSNNAIARVGELDMNNIFNFRYENVSRYQRNGAKLNFSKFFKPGIIFQTNLEVYHSTIVSTSKTNTLMDWRGDVDLIYMFMKSESMLGLKYQRQQSKYISGLGYDKGDVDFWMMFYKRPFFKNNASVMVGYFFPLDFGTNYNQGFHVETEGFTSHTDIDVNLVKNMFLIEFSLRISKGKSIKKTEKQIEQESENGGGGMF